MDFLLELAAKAALEQTLFRTEPAEFLRPDRPFSSLTQPQPRHITPVNDLRPDHPLLWHEAHDESCYLSRACDVQHLALDCRDLDGHVICSRWRLGNPLLWVRRVVACEAVRTPKGTRDAGFIAGGLRLARRIPCTGSMRSTGKTVDPPDLCRHRTLVGAFRTPAIFPVTRTWPLVCPSRKPPVNGVPMRVILLHQQLALFDEVGASCGDLRVLQTASVVQGSGISTEGPSRLFAVLFRP